MSEIKATNKDNLSDVEKIEMIKEERIKEIHEIDYLVDFIDYGLSFVQDDKYKEIIENEESDLSKKIKELEILANNPISELRNDIDKIQEQINSSYCKVFSSSGIHLNIGIGDIGFDPAKSLLSGSRIDISETGNFARWDQQGTGSQRALFWSILQVRSELSRVSDIQKELQKLVSKKAQSSKDKEKIQKLIEAEANKYMQKKEPLLGDEYFRLEPNEKRALIVGLRNSVFEQMQESITITSDEQLKEKVELLDGQVTEQNKIIEEDREKSTKILKEKEQLEKELDELKETQAEQDNEITHLKNRLKAHTNQQIKIDEQSALIKSKVRENQSLTRKTENLQSENTELRDFNDKSLGLLLEIASTDPELKEIIVNEMPELSGKFTKDDALMEMG